MRASLLASVSLLILTPVTGTAADSDEPFVGTWMSTDGSAKQEFVREFDEGWIGTQMWFKSDDGWKRVAVGSMYRRPGDDRWFSAGRAVDMSGIELFESTLRKIDDRRYAVTNVAYKADGSTMKSEEDWFFDGPHKFEYTIYTVEEGARTELMRGVWQRAPDGD